MLEISSAALTFLTATTFPPPSSGSSTARVPSVLSPPLPHLPSDRNPSPSWCSDSHSYFSRPVRPSKFLGSWVSWAPFATVQRRGFCYFLALHQEKEHMASCFPGPETQQMPSSSEAELLYSQGPPPQVSVSQIPLLTVF